MRKSQGKVTHRITTHRSNGNLSQSVEVAPEPVPIGEAMRLAVEQLGESRVDPALAPTQLIELGYCYEEVVRRKAAFEAKNDDAKVAKKSLESATELLLEKVRACTHPAALPLFDQVEAKDDLDTMLDGGDVEPESDQAPA